MHVFTFSHITTSLHVTDTVSNLLMKMRFEPQAYLSSEVSQKYRIKFNEDRRKKIWGTFQVD